MNHRKLYLHLVVIGALVLGVFAGAQRTPTGRAMSATPHVGSVFFGQPQPPCGELGDLGVRSTFLTAWWGQLEPQNDQWNWEPLDQVLDWLLGCGLEVLVKVACEAAVGKRESISIFGTDYPTPDGTGVRDYIHVEDLADAHLKALSYLRDGGDSATLNCGYGHGYSVREVLDAVERLSGKQLTITEDARRPGDPPTLVAQAERIVDLLGWSPRYDDLDLIVEHSLNWERAPRY